VTAASRFCGKRSKRAIEDHVVIGDLHTVTLVATDGG
jgi:hypothetical protein